MEGEGWREGVMRHGYSFCVNCVFSEIRNQKSEFLFEIHAVSGLQLQKKQCRVVSTHYTTRKTKCSVKAGKFMKPSRRRYQRKKSSRSTIFYKRVPIQSFGFWWHLQGSGMS